MGVYDWEMKFYNALYYISGVNSVKTDYDEYSNTLSVVVGGEFGASYNAPDEYEIRSKYEQEGKKNESSYQRYRKRQRGYHCRRKRPLRKARCEYSRHHPKRFKRIFCHDHAGGYRQAEYPLCAVCG